MSPLARIDKMGVDNVGFLIDNLGADAAPLQYLRELVQNEIEAVQRANVTDGQIVIDSELVAGVPKLRISGNGLGMTPEEVQRNINQLSASSGTQAFDKNFGIGAKITAGTRNPHGVMYKTWKNGVGALTIMGRVDGDYGRLPIPNEDGGVDYWIPLRDDQKPPMIDQHGVSVVLLGQSAEDDTTKNPPEAELPSQWVAAYLERRYFQLPPNVSIHVRRAVEIYDSELSTRRAISDTIRGQRYYLDQHSDYRGHVPVPAAQATVFWWLLKEEIIQGGKTWNNRGHVAAIYQDELYEMRSGPGRTSALKDFGIYAGFSHIVIYVEPHDVLKANTARTLLILKSSVPIDYAAIGEAFVEQMPSELEAFMAGQVATEPGDHRKAIRKALKEVEDALNEARYRRNQRSRAQRLETEPGGVTNPALVEAGTEIVERRVARADATGRVGAEYLRRARDDDARRTRAERINSDPAPKVVWEKDGASVQPGRAAMYARNAHTVTASTRFELYQDLVEWGIREAKTRGVADIDDATLKTIVEDEVQRWFAQAFIEVVVVLRPKEHDANWGPRVFETALSDEGLTAALVSHRWHMMSAIKRGLAGRLGHKKEAVA